MSGGKEEDYNEAINASALGNSIDMVTTLTGDLLYQEELQTDQDACNTVQKDGGVMCGIFVNTPRQITTKKREFLMTPADDNVLHHNVKKDLDDFLTFNRNFYTDQRIFYTDQNSAEKQAQLNEAYNALMNKFQIQATGVMYTYFHRANGVLVVLSGPQDRHLDNEYDFREGTVFVTYEPTTGDPGGGSVMVRLVYPRRPPNPQNLEIKRDAPDSEEDKEERDIHEERIEEEHHTAQKETERKQAEIFRQKIYEGARNMYYAVSQYNVLNPLQQTVKVLPVSLIGELGMMMSGRRQKNNIRRPPGVGDAEAAMETVRGLAAGACLVRDKKSQKIHILFYPYEHSLIFNDNVNAMVSSRDIASTYTVKTPNIPTTDQFQAMLTVFHFDLWTVGYTAAQNEAMVQSKQLELKGLNCVAFSDLCGIDIAMKNVRKLEISSRGIASVSVVEADAALKNAYRYICGRIHTDYDTARAKIQGTKKKGVFKADQVMKSFINVTNGVLVVVSKIPRLPSECPETTVFVKGSRGGNCFVYVAWPCVSEATTIAHVTDFKHDVFAASRNLYYGLLLFNRRTQTKLYSKGVFLFDAIQSVKMGLSFWLDKALPNGVTLLCIAKEILSGMTHAASRYTEQGDSAIHILFAPATDAKIFKQAHDVMQNDVKKNEAGKKHASPRYTFHPDEIAKTYKATFNKHKPEKLGAFTPKPNVVYHEYVRYNYGSASVEELRRLVHHGGDYSNQGVSVFYQDTSGHICSTNLSSDQKVDLENKTKTILHRSQLQGIKCDDNEGAFIVTRFTASTESLIVVSENTDTAGCPAGTVSVCKCGHPFSLSVVVAQPCVGSDAHMFLTQVYMAARNAYYGVTAYNDYMTQETDRIKVMTIGLLCSIDSERPHGVSKELVATEMLKGIGFCVKSLRKQLYHTIQNDPKQATVDDTEGKDTEEGDPPGDMILHGNSPVRIRFFPEEKIFLDALDAMEWKEAYVLPRKPQAADINPASSLCSRMHYERDSAYDPGTKYKPGFLTFNVVRMNIDMWVDVTNSEIFSNTAHNLSPHVNTNESRAQRCELYTRIHVLCDSYMKDHDRMHMMCFGDAAHGTLLIISKYPHSADICGSGTVFVVEPKKDSVALCIVWPWVDQYYNKQNFLQDVFDATRNMYYGVLQHNRQKKAAGQWGSLIEILPLCLCYRHTDQSPKNLSSEEVADAMLKGLANSAELYEVADDSVFRVMCYPEDDAHVFEKAFTNIAKDTSAPPLSLIHDKPPHVAAAASPGRNGDVHNLNAEQQDNGDGPESLQESGPKKKKIT